MRIRLAAYALLLFASWNFNLLGLPDGPAWSRSDPRAGYVGTDSHLVMYRLARHDVHPLHPMYYDGPTERRVYTSQFCLQAVVMVALGTTPETAPIAAGVVALLTALVAGAVFAAAQRDLGAPVGDVACTLAAFAPVFVTFAPSLYWVPFLLLLPFAVVWCGGTWATTAKRRALLIGGVTACVWLKCLCGYEYITTVILAPVAAAWFHQHRGGESFGRKLGGATLLVGAGLLGFALALGTHVLQVSTVLGEDGVAAIRDRAAARTGGTLDVELPGWSASGLSRAAFAARCFGDYFHQRALGGPAVLGKWSRDVPLKWAALFAAAFVGVALARRKARSVGALAGALLLGFAAAVSWQVLAINHMCVHRHLNLIVFAVPFLPVAFVAAGFALKFVGGRVGIGLLVALPILMGVNAAHSARLAALDAEAQRLAEVDFAQREGRTGPVGSLDRSGSMSSYSPGLLMSWGLFDPQRLAAAEPDAVVATGWVSDAWKSSIEPSARVVAVSGGKVVPCRVLWFRRPDLDYLARKPIHRAGFVAVVPSGGAVRLFAVSAAGATELNP